MDAGRLADLSMLLRYPEERPVEAWAHLGGPDGGEVPDLRTLQARYVSLFVNAVPEVPCPPWASVVLEGQLMGKAAAAVQRLYQRWDVAPEDLPDHVALELAFLGRLVELADEDPAAAEDRDWLVGHLRSWLPAFLDSVERHDGGGFYGSVARAARGAGFRPLT